MKLPPLINSKLYLIPNSNGQIDRAKLLYDTWKCFEKDFISGKVLFENYQVQVRDKPLDCSVCNHNCSNIFFDCPECPWRGKLDIFQHVTTDEDKTLENKLTKEAKKRLKKRRKVNPSYKIRTPGVFSKSRVIRISWIKFLIEHSDDDEIIKKVSPSRINEERIKIYHEKQDYLVIISRTMLPDGTFELYLNSAYHNPYNSLLRDLYN